jgi:hypothetical protein
VISDDVRRFVLTSIPSVPYLEAVLLFHHSAAVERDAGEVARALYVPEPRAQELLDLLLSAGILASCPGVPPRWRFEPRDEALRLAIHELALAYPSDVIAITHLIHDSAGRNAHMFADAFRIRKD